MTRSTANAANIVDQNIYIIYDNKYTPAPVLDVPNTCGHVNHSEHSSVFTLLYSKFRDAQPRTDFEIFLFVIQLKYIQHCSRLSQNALRHIPCFKCDIQFVPISITAAITPALKPTSNTHNQPDQAS